MSTERKLKITPGEWPQHIRKEMEAFIRMYPDATQDMIERHADAMDFLTPEKDKASSDLLARVKELEADLAMMTVERDHERTLRMSCESALEGRDAENERLREGYQQAVDALKFERDEWHKLHDGNCETLLADDALSTAANNGITPTER